VKTSIPEAILNLVRCKAAQAPAAAIQSLMEAARARHGDAVQAILFYGSCLRSGDHRDGMVDLYVIVDRYRKAYRSRYWALLNKMLPPNVFYIETHSGARVVRAKYAILSMADLKRGTSHQWFHSYLWGRFAQPAALVYACSPQVADVVHRALSQAVLTFLGRVIPRLPARFSVEELWLKGLTLSYRTELRAERPEKMAALFHSAPDYYARVTDAALPALPFGVESVGESDERLYRTRISSPVRLRSRLGWALRTLQGKVLTILRLLKGAFTFTGGLDYILWKIERHTGVTVEVPPKLEHHPILALCVLSWRLYRKGAFR
jgi:predicted nucleotidyltransferase